MVARDAVRRASEPEQDIGLAGCAKQAAVRLIQVGRTLIRLCAGPALLLLAAAALSSCTKHETADVANPATPAEPDRCIDLFETAWGHLDALKELGAAKTTGASPAVLLSGLLRASASDRETARRTAYERERAELAFIVQTMKSLDCPPPGLKLTQIGSP